MKFWLLSTHTGTVSLSNINWTITISVHVQQRKAKTTENNIAIANIYKQSNWLDKSDGDGRSNKVAESNAFNLVTAIYQVNCKQYFVRAFSKK